MKDTKKHTEAKEKAAQIEEKLKEFLKDYNNEEFGTEEGRELLKLFRKFRREEPEKIERGRNPDLLAAALVYIRLFVFEGIGGKRKRYSKPVIIGR